MQTIIHEKMEQAPASYGASEAPKRNEAEFLADFRSALFDTARASQADTARISVPRVQRGDTDKAVERFARKLAQYFPPDEEEGSLEADEHALALLLITELKSLHAFNELNPTGIRIWIDKHAGQYLHATEEIAEFRKDVLECLMVAKKESGLSSVSERAKS